MVDFVKISRERNLLPWMLFLILQKSSDGLGNQSIILLLLHHRSSFQLPTVITEQRVALPWSIDSLCNNTTVRIQGIKGSVQHVVDCKSVGILSTLRKIKNSIKTETVFIDVSLIVHVLNGYFSVTICHEHFHGVIHGLDLYRTVDVSVGWILHLFAFSSFFSEKFTNFKNLFLQKKGNFGLSVLPSVKFPPIENSAEDDCTKKLDLFSAGHFTWPPLCILGILYCLQTTWRHSRQSNVCKVRAPVFDFRETLLRRVCI